MKKIGETIFRYTKNALPDLPNFFNLIAFRFLTGKNDMHLKNFSLIAGNSKSSHLPPVYGLLNTTIINSDGTEELILTLGRRKRKFTIFILRPGQKRDC